MARLLKTANLNQTWPWHSARAFQRFQEFPAPIGLQKFQEFPAPIGLQKFLNFVCDRVLSPKPTFANLSQDARTRPRNLMPCYSSFPANLKQPTGAIFSHDSYSFSNRRNRCHIPQDSNDLSFWPFGLRPLALASTGQNDRSFDFYGSGDVATISPI